MLIFSEYYPDTGVAGIMVIHSSAYNSLSCYTGVAYRQTVPRDEFKPVCDTDHISR